MKRLRGRLAFARVTATAGQVSPLTSLIAGPSLRGAGIRKPDWRHVRSSLDADQIAARQSRQAEDPDLTCSIQINYLRFWLDLLCSLTGLHYYR